MLGGWGRRVGRDSMTINCPQKCKKQITIHRHGWEIESSNAARRLVLTYSLKYGQYVLFGIDQLP